MAYILILLILGVTVLVPVLWWSSERGEESGISDGDMEWVLFLFEQWIVAGVDAEQCWEDCVLALSRRTGASYRQCEGWMEYAVEYRWGISRESLGIRSIEGKVLDSLIDRVDSRRNEE